MIPEVLNIHGKLTPEFKAFQEDHRNRFLNNIRECVVPREQLDPRLPVLKECAITSTGQELPFMGEATLNPMLFIMMFSKLNKKSVK